MQKIGEKWGGMGGMGTCEKLPRKNILGNVFKKSVKLMGNRRKIGGKCDNSIAFSKSTSQRIYPKQHTFKIGEKQTSVFELHRLKNCTSKMCTNPV